VRSTLQRCRFKGRFVSEPETCLARRRTRATNTAATNNYNGLYGSETLSQLTAKRRHRGVRTMKSWRYYANTTSRISWKRLRPEFGKVFWSYFAATISNSSRLYSTIIFI